VGKSDLNSELDRASEFIMMKGLDCPLRSFQCFCNTARRTAARKQQERRSFFPSRSGIL